MIRDAVTLSSTIRFDIERGKPRRFIHLRPPSLRPSVPSSLRPFVPLSLLMPTLIDISPPITPDLKVFPGDTPPSREVLLDMQRGDHLTLSTLHATVHLGAHVDGPNHYEADAPGVEGWPLDLFIGPCQVIDCPPVSPEAERVQINELRAAITQPRVLLRTGAYPDPNQWQAFPGLAPTLVDHLADAGVTLVGVDTPSVDPPTAKVLDAHHRFRARGVAILEGIVLSHVEPGDYELIAMPLPLVGFDASPVRAALRRS